MNTRLAIIRSEGKEHLCYREEECFVDVSYPMVTFTKGRSEERRVGKEGRSRWSQYH